MWFKKNYDQTTGKKTDRLARGVADLILTVQLKLAARLRRWDATLSIAVKKRLFVALFSCCTFYCVYLLGRAFFPGAVKATPLMISNEFIAPVLPQRPVKRGTNKLNRPGDTAKGKQPIFKP